MKLYMKLNASTDCLLIFQRNTGKDFCTVIGDATLAKSKLEAYFGSPWKRCFARYNVLYMRMDM